MKSEGDEPEVEKIGGNKESVDCKKELGFIDRWIRYRTLYKINDQMLLFLY